MEAPGDISEFLTSRRARITPAQAGLPTFGERRRVPGLRREEVASLAGVSVDYYARLERGNLRGVSDTVLDGLARALQLDEIERSHLYDLAHLANASTPPLAPAQRSPRIRSSLRTLLASLTVPAYLRDSAMSIVAANEPCVALYGDVLLADRLPLNLARFTFLDDHAKSLFGDWDAVADNMVAALRLEVGRSPRNRALSDLIGELTTQSRDFSRRWAKHEVRAHRTSRKVLHNAVVGDVDLTGDALELTGDGLTLIVYTADAGSAASEALSLLASWSSSPERLPANREA